jgi:site-specific recombinase XerD
LPGRGGGSSSGPAYRKGRVWYELRRACATTMSSNGVPLEVIREQLGHATVTTTELYLQLDQQAKRGAAKKGLV